jgi:hypothetical protein
VDVVIRCGWFGRATRRRLIHRTKTREKTTALCDLIIFFVVDVRLILDRYATATRARA